MSDTNNTNEVNYDLPYEGELDQLDFECELENLEDGLYEGE